MQILDWREKEEEENTQRALRRLLQKCDVYKWWKLRTKHSQSKDTYQQFHM